MNFKSLLKVLLLVLLSSVRCNAGWFMEQFGGELQVVKALIKAGIPLDVRDSQEQLCI